MTDAASHDESVALNPQEEIDRVCGQFEAQWKSSRRPEIEVLIADSHGPSRTELLRKLLAIEFQYRLRLGEQPSTAEYDARFPGDLPVIREVFENSSRKSRPRLPRRSRRRSAGAAPRTGESRPIAHRRPRAFASSARMRRGGWGRSPSPTTKS